MKQNTAVVLGAGGFIGSHMVNRLKSEGYWVRGVDLKYPEFSESKADEFIIGDLRNPSTVSRVLFNDGVKDSHQKYLGDSENSFDEVYSLAADMGGAGYVFTKCNDANIMHNSALINLNVAHFAVKFGVKKLFYSSSACVYNQDVQDNPDNPGLKESDAYPVYPDSDYGYEKIFSERLYQAFNRNFGLNIRIARFHNIFGTEGTWNGGKEKFPAAICRKVAEADDWVEVWGDGEQTRSYLFIDECIEGVRRLMASNVIDPINIGSDEMISVNNLAKMVCEISGKQTVFVKHIDGPQGVRGRNSNNDLIKEKLGWAPSQPLRVGMEILYKWVNEKVNG